MVAEEIEIASEAEITPVLRHLLAHNRGSTPFFLSLAPHPRTRGIRLRPDF
jgi:hypothetical protein